MAPRLLALAAVAVATASAVVLSATSADANNVAPRYYIPAAGSGTAQHDAYGPRMATPTKRPKKPTKTKRPAPAPVVTATAAPAPQTIADIVTGNDDFSVLLTALQTASLVETLDDESASLTVFAPTNGAFLSLAQTLGYTGDNVDGVFAFLVEALTGLSNGGNPVPLLTSVLRFHVVGSTVSSTELVSTGFFEPLEGPAVVLADDGRTLYDFAPGVADPMLVVDRLDIQASNGVIHVITGVLLPVPVLSPAPVVTAAPVQTMTPVAPTRPPRYSRPHGGNGGRNRGYGGHDGERSRRYRDVYGY